MNLNDTYILLSSRKTGKNHLLLTNMEDHDYDVSIQIFNHHLSHNQSCGSGSFRIKFTFFGFSYIARFFTVPKFSNSSEKQKSNK